MPMYEYFCQNCDRMFDVSCSLTEHDSEPVKCPSCKEANVKQRLSSFVAVASKKS